MAGAALVSDTAALQIAQGRGAAGDEALDVAFRFTAADADDHDRVLRIPEATGLRLSLSTHMMPVSFPSVNPPPSRIGVRTITGAKNGTRIALSDAVKVSLILTFALLCSLPAAAELRLRVDLSDRTLDALVDGRPAASWDVAVGKDDYPTPRGSFSIRKVIYNPAWVPPKSKWARNKTATPPGHPDNPMKKVKMFFREPDYYIHGTGDEDSLGSAASHGCIRMSATDVTELSRMVMEHGGEPKSAPWYRRIFRSRSTKAVYLSEPVPIEIVE